ncbi:sensor histidine kinase [Actinocorallia sp. B10E7]|uniref:sensor histidine kinase n=1 Tax=Actinocorallia sp. B10E7 TaxID=3153558 RepID=UPI00325D506A
MSFRIRDLRIWLGGHPQVPDGIVAALLVVLTLVDLAQDTAFPGHTYTPHDAAGYTVTVLVIAVLTVRQRFPMSVLAVVLCGEVFLAVGNYQTSGDVFAFLIAVYTVAAHLPLARSALAGLVSLAVLVTLMIGSDDGFFSLIADLGLFAGVWWLGRSLRLRRSYLAELEDRAARLEKARFADARTARVEERSRIARELHDVVAHHVSVMTVQAGAARRIMERDPASAREAVETIEQVGRTTLSEMRRIVGVLRTERDPAASAAELTPQPGTQDLTGLVEQIRETGLAVQMRVDGEPRDLSTGVDLAVYRLVQEALTNCLKHAGPHARAWVHLKYSDRALTLEVADDGRGASEATCADPGPGHGLVGMRERVALYGGELRIGPRAGGGFEVRARFPLEVK